MKTPRACGSRWRACTRKSWATTGRRSRPTSTPWKAATLPVAEMRYRQGECYEKDGKMEEALGAYGQSAAASPAADAFRIASLARLAEIAEERGDNRTAVRHWQSIINAGGKPEWTQMATERLSLLQSWAWRADRILFDLETAGSGPSRGRPFSVPRCSSIVGPDGKRILKKASKSATAPTGGIPFAMFPGKRPEALQTGDSRPISSGGTRRLHAALPRKKQSD